MTKNTKAIIALIGFTALAMLSACANTPFIGNHDSSGKEIAASGPTVLNAHAEPSTVELNQSLIPFGQARVLADVKDFTATVSEVHLRFKSVPIDIPMQNIGGTTWLATLTQTQLQELAVRGKTITYDAEVFAKDQKGQSVLSNNPVTIAVKAPDASSTATG